MEHLTLVILIFAVFVLVDCNVFLVCVSDIEVVTTEIRLVDCRSGSIQILSGVVDSVCGQIVIFVSSNDDALSIRANLLC